MQLSHLDAIISEWSVNNGTKHGAQRIFPAARVACTFGQVFEFCRGRFEEAKTRSPWFASLHSCAATLEDEDAAHDEALEILEALMRPDKAL